MYVQLADLPGGDDKRLTMGLLHDLCAVLRKHGYTIPTHPRMLSNLLVGVYKLTRITEGGDP